MKKIFKTPKYAALLASLVNLGCSANAQTSETHQENLKDSSKFGNGSFSSSDSDNYYSPDEPFETNDFQIYTSLEKIFSDAERAGRDVNLVTEIIIDEKNNMLPAAMTRKGRYLQRNTKKRIQEFLKENMNVEDGKNLAIDQDVLSNIDKIEEKYVVNLLYKINSSSKDVLDQTLNDIKGKLWNAISEDFSDSITQLLIGLSVLEGASFKYKEIRDFLGLLQNDTSRYLVLKNLMEISSDQRKSLFAQHKEIHDFLGLLQNDSSRYLVLKNLIEISSDQRESLFAQHKEISDFLRLLQNDTYRHMNLEVIITLPADQRLPRLTRVREEINRLGVDNIREGRIIDLLDTPLNQPLPDILNNMGDNQAHGVNIHSGDRDDRSTKAMTLLLDSQKDLSINWEEQFNDFEQNIDVILDGVIADSKERLKKAKLHPEQYENVIKGRNADKVRVKQVLGMGDVPQVKGFGSFLSSPISSYGLKNMNPKEFLGRIWYFASHTEDPLNAKISMMTGLADSIEDDGDLVCNPGKMQRMIISVLQGRLKGVNIDGISVPSPLKDADKSLIDQVIMELEKNNGDINVEAGIRLVNEKTPIIHNDDIKDYINLRKGQIAHLKRLEIFNKQHKSQKELETRKSQHLDEDEEIRNDPFLKEVFNMIGQDGSLSFTKSEFDAFITQFENDEKQAQTAPALMALVRSYLNDHKNVEPDEFRGYAQNYSLKNFKGKK